LPRFGGELRVEHDLEEQVAEFLAQFRIDAVFDRIDDFVGLFDEVAHERGVGLLAVPRARAPQAGHDLHQIVPVLMARAGRQRQQRHRDRGRQRSARHPGHDLGDDPPAFERAQEHRQAGKVGERVAEDAEREIRAVQPFDETVDHFGRTADEERLIGDHPAQEPRRLRSREEHQVRRRQDGHRTTDRAQGLAAAEGEEVGVARTESPTMRSMLGALSPNRSRAAWS